MTSTEESTILISPDTLHVVHKVPSPLSCSPSSQPHTSLPWTARCRCTWSRRCCCWSDTHQSSGKDWETPSTSGCHKTVLMGGRIAINHLPSLLDQPVNWGAHLHARPLPAPSHCPPLKQRFCNSDKLASYDQLNQCWIQALTFGFAFFFKLAILGISLVKVFNVHYFRIVLKYSTLNLNP